MSRLARLASAAALACFALAGCAANGALNPSADAAIQNALSVGCPILAAVQASSLPLNSVERSAVRTLALVCPPNPPPTSAVIAAEDIISAYLILGPVIK